LIIFECLSNQVTLMSESDKENVYVDNQKTIADIERYDLSVIAIEATDYLPFRS